MSCWASSYRAFGSRASLITLVGLLIACDSSTPASRSWEVAAQGLYGGAISSDADYIIAGSLNHGASLWRLPAHERLYNWAHRSGDFTELVAADFSPDASHAITADPRTIVLWDVRDGHALKFWATPGKVLDVALLNDNRQALLGMDDHSALLFDAREGSYHMTLLHEGEVGAVDVSRDGQLAITGSDDYRAIIWSLNRGEPLHTLMHGNPVRHVAISDAGEFAFTAAQGERVAIWNVEDGRLLHTLHNGINHGVLSGRFSPDGRYLAVGYTHRKVVLYDVISGRAVRSWDPGKRNAMIAKGAAVLELAFSPEGVRALLGDGRVVELPLT